MSVFLHQLPNVDELFRVVARENGSIDEGLIEKDYWIMHCLWGIQQQGYRFELKGGTSLSKGFGIIERFSEDIDIQIHPSDSNVKVGKNHNKPSQPDLAVRKLYEDEFKKKPKIYYGKQPKFAEILKRILEYAHRL